MDPTTEKIYEQVNENWRFLAKWRQMAFAGHLAVLAGALSFTNFAVEHAYSRIVVGFCFLLVAGLSFIFWIADRRTHRLTMHACAAGAELEGTKAGFFRVNATLDSEERVRHDVSRRWRMCGHSKAAFLLFVGSSAVFLIAAIITFAGSIPSQGRKTAVWTYTIIHGPVTDAVASPGSLGKQLSRATAEGWDFVSTGTDPSIGSFVILRRETK